MLLRAKVKQFIFKICWNKFTIDSQRRKSPCYVLWSATRLIWQGACASSSGKTKSEYQSRDLKRYVKPDIHTCNVPASPTLFDRINWQISRFLKGSWKLTKLLSYVTSKAHLLFRFIGVFFPLRSYPVNLSKVLNDYP